MKAQVQWIDEAVDLLSDGFSRKEAIRQMVEDGCHPKEAITTVNELIEDSRQYGRRLARQGFLMLFCTICFAFFSTYTNSFVFPELVFLGASAGLFYVARGLNRLWSV